MFHQSKIKTTRIKLKHWNAAVKTVSAMVDLILAVLTVHNYVVPKIISSHSITSW